MKTHLEFLYDMVAVYNMSDAVVLPSLWEGFPNVLLEAMSVGIPVIASDIVDNRKIVFDGVNGYLFQSNDQVGLSTILEKITGEGSERLSGMGEEGRSIARGRYAMENMVKAYENLYIECVR